MDIPTKKKIVSEDSFKISRMKQEIKATNPHKHDHYHELIFLTSGAGFHTIDLGKNLVQPPQLFLVKAGQVHHWEFTSIPKGFVIIFRSNFLVNLTSSDIASNFEQLQKSSFNLKKSQAQSLETIFEQMQEEYDAQDEQETRIIASFLEVVLARMIRYSNRSKPSQIDSKQELVNNYSELIHKPLQDHHLVKDYAEQLHVTPTHLNEVCRSVLDQTASEVLDEAIILEAKRQLIYTSESVANIGYDLGYNDASNFSTFFKRHACTSPGAFRKKML